MRSLAKNLAYQRYDFVFDFVGRFAEQETNFARSESDMFQGILDLIYYEYDH